MTIRVWVWLRGEFLLESFLPLDFSVPKTPSARLEAAEVNAESPGRRTAIEGAHALLDECQSRRWDRLGVLQWSQIVEEVGLDNALSEAVFRNASGPETYATLPMLAVHMLLVGLEYFTYESDEVISIRGDIVTAMVHEQMEDFICILYRCATGCSRADLRKDKLRISGSQMKKFLSMVDILFEGMMENDEEMDSHDEIVNVSVIAERLWLHNGEVSIPKFISNMRQCLVQDPFQIDDLSVDTPSSSPRRVTSLAGTRRKVTVSGWQRFQLLSKAVYKDVHLRISSNRTQSSMLVAPWRCRSIIVDRVTSCPAMVLGPTYGSVILREVHHTNISVACKQLYLWNSSDVTVFLHSPNPPTLRGCTGIRFAPFNVSYEGLEEELAAAGLRTCRYEAPKHVINLDDSETSMLPATDFYLQPVPIVNKESDVKDLLDKLCPAYRKEWEAALQRLQTIPNDDSSSPLSKTDLLYLRGKITAE
ncbi:hypothetical protein Y032_0113g364 [Ancylostoma ceylanicum]|nr:hypothetical protein Y032_0113g364 [Ancylostoma ceylanicum]